MNFIDIEDLAQSIAHLKKVPTLHELYLTGNPCEQWSGCKDYIIANLPFLAFLNGTEILKSDKIRATQQLPFLERDLEKAALENLYKKEIDPDKDNPNRYTKEYRRKLYKEIEEEKLEKEKQKSSKSKSPWDPEPPQGPYPVYKDNGEIRVCNQGKFDFYLNEDIFVSGITLFELKLPKFLQTTEINVDLNPQYIRVVVKDKVTQLKFSYEIIVEKSVIQRSTTTGHLVVKCPILGYENKWNGVDLTSYNEEEFKVIKKKMNEQKKKKESEEEKLDMDNMLKQKTKTKKIECKIIFVNKIY